MRVRVDQDRCCSSGLCVQVAPDVFDQRDEDGVVVVLDAMPPEGNRRDVQAAADGCPTQAIGIDDD